MAEGWAGELVAPTGDLDTPARRLADAELILTMVRASAEWEQATGRAARVKPLRELMWFTWEQPRLPKPLYLSKYPLTAPWTPAAFARYEQRARGLVIEHVTPASVLVRRLLEEPPAAAEDLMRLLEQITYVVITDDDNRLLKAAGVDSSLAPGSDDPWDRYRVAGLKRSMFHTPVIVHMTGAEQDAAMADFIATVERRRAAPEG